MYVTAAQDDALKRLARKHRTTESELLRRAIDEYLSRADGPAEDPLLKLAGRFEATVTDGSTNVDRDVYGGE